MNWTIYLRPEVIRYLVGLRDKGTEIRAIIAGLSSAGIPGDARRTPNTNRWLWTEAKHWITCVVDEPDHAIHVTQVESHEDFLKRITRGA